MAALDPDNMDEYLEQYAQVVDEGMREKIQMAGFLTLDSLVKKKLDYAQKVCKVVRRSAEGTAEEKDVPIDVEEHMENLVLYARYCYVVQRPLEYDLANEDNLGALRSWFDQAEMNSPDAHGVPTFTDDANKKAWFESIYQCLRSKTGSSGFPLLYVIERQEALPQEDPGFGMPSFDQELASRGRHNGHYWRGDNMAVWLLIKDITHGTTAWSFVKAYASSNDGRGAYMALEATYMGSNIRLLLMKRAEATLATAVYDGKTKGCDDWIKHTSKLREAFDDLEAAGQPMSGFLKVIKLMASFQFEKLMHVTTAVQVDPRCREDFEAACALIQGEISSLKMLNTPPDRNVSAVDTEDAIDAGGEADSDASDTDDGDSGDKADERRQAALGLSSGTLQ